MRNEKWAEWFVVVLLFFYWHIRPSGCLMISPGPALECQWPRFPWLPTQRDAVVLSGLTTCFGHMESDASLGSNLGVVMSLSLCFGDREYMPFILPFPSYRLLPFRFGGFTKVFSTFFTPTLLESNSPLDVRIKRHTTLLTVFRRWFWPFTTSCVSFCGSSIGRGPK